MSTESLLDHYTLQFKQVVDIGGSTLTGIQQDSADILAVYLPTCDV